MNLSEADREALKEFLGTYGGKVVLAMLAEDAKEPQDELYQIMKRKPDTLTGKTAIKLAARCSALEDFRESLLDAAKLAPSNQPQPARAG